MMDTHIQLSKLAKKTEKNMLIHRTWFTFVAHQVFTKSQGSIEMNLEAAQNYKIKVTPETSEEVQSIFFELGGNWPSTDKELKHTDKKFLFLCDLAITYHYDSKYFDDHQSKEITLKQLRKIALNKSAAKQSFLETEKAKFDAFYNSASKTLKMDKYEAFEIWLERAKLDGSNN